MKGFIEVTPDRHSSKALVHVSHIEIIRKSSYSSGAYIETTDNSLVCKETYEEVKAIIEKAVE